MSETYRTDNPHFRYSTIINNFKKDFLAFSGLICIIALFSLALLAPLLANGRPLIVYVNGQLSSPMLHFFFAPDSTETLVEKIFNFLLLYIPAAILLSYILKKFPGIKKICLVCMAIFIAIPFITTKSKLDKTDWRKKIETFPKGSFVLFAPIPYGPFENTSEPYQKPNRKHFFGTDQIGRDVCSRMLYGARVSLSVGIFATFIAMVIGIIIGIISGYYGGLTDIIIMRVVEIIICFPTFLLLLILMAIFQNFKQSVLLVIGIIGITGWTGLARLVRGEVLKNRALAYIQSCITLGIPTWKIMFVHLLKNISGVIFVSFTFSVAGAILAESGLSFLGFGVKAPTASWGELLRQAFDNPVEYWHLTLFPGIALFLAVTGFNFTGEGLRKMLDPKIKT